MGSGTSLDYCDLTDIGRRRANNQDSKAVLVPLSGEQFRRRGWLFVVADGMGAHAAGEQASALAVEHVPLAYEKLAARSPPLALRTSIEHANSEIHARGENAFDLRGMGTTCTALALVPRGAVIGHVGDSRAYRIRGDRIEQWSADHSLAWDWEAGRLPGMDEPQKNIITRSMGPHPQVAVDLEGPVAVEAGDVLVLCSDGLSGQVADEEIGLLAGRLPPKEAAEALLGLSLVRGAPDNVTLIVARVGEKEASRIAAGDPPWPLAAEIPSTAAPQPVPWKMLGVAAASLLVALLASPWSSLMQDNGPIGGLLGPDLAPALAFVVPAAMALLFIGSLLAAVLAYFVSGGEAVSMLQPGARLGSGPYRSYECRPSEPLLEGIVASVESAADGLSPGDRQALLEAVAAARRPIANHDFPAAIAGAAEAIAIYRRIVDASRSDDTAHG